MDFVVHLPLRYEDNTCVNNINEVQPGQRVQLEGHTTDVTVVYKPKKQLHAKLVHDNAYINLRWLYFYPSQISQLKSGNKFRVRGEVRRGYNGLEIVHPKILSSNRPLPQKLSPIYPTTEGLSQQTIQKAINHALENADLHDTLPQEVINKYKLMPFEQAINQLHNPTSDTNISGLINQDSQAWQRIKLDELLAQQIALINARLARQKQNAIALNDKADSLINKFKDNLPFELTKAQSKVTKEITDDLAQNYPMHRLLQGDVGSGKTVVAAIAILQAVVCNKQAAIMAPTEILAQQHYQKISNWFEPLGINVCLLTSSLTTKQKRIALSSIKDGATQLVIGTQALIQEQVDFKSLSLVVLDEQHRFGVGQRLELNKKGDALKKGEKIIPHQLNMSATPIPRTLAMTFLADLQVSVIDELPSGRKPIVTKLVVDDRREELIHYLSQEANKNRQIYWVCPLIDESEALQLQTAMQTYDTLVDSFPTLKIGLIHGKLNATEKQDVMQAFSSGELQILVATTVIEVGVDVPNASIMIIENAERFGLAQLHQLRGRVGRGSQESVCILLYQNPLSQVARKRLKAMYQTTDGFEIAQYDLDIRGPGEFLGTKQSGQQLLRFADLSNDVHLIEMAQEIAKFLINQYPDNANQHAKRWIANQQDLLRS